MARDDFSATLKITLALRVAHKCSNPDCRVATSGPQVDSAKALNLGVAAHISAAAAGGPRFNEGLLAEVRSGIDNAIWLCQNCAKLIDNDPARYPSELLSAWKTVAEYRALNSVGKSTSEFDPPAIVEKFVSLNYVEASGLAPRLKAQGYDLHWVSADREMQLVDLDGWEYAEELSPEGWQIRFKVRDSSCDYLVLLKRKST